MIIALEKANISLHYFNKHYLFIKMGFPITLVWFCFGSLSVSMSNDGDPILGSAPHRSAPRQKKRKKKKKRFLGKWYRWSVGTCQTSGMGGDAIITETTEPTEIGGPLFCHMEIGKRYV